MQSIEDQPTSSKHTVVRAPDGSTGKVVEVKAAGYTLKMSDGSFKFAAHRELVRDPGNRFLVHWNPGVNSKPSAGNLHQARMLMKEARKADGLDELLRAWRAGELPHIKTPDQTPAENDFQKSVSLEVRRLLGLPADAQGPTREVSEARQASTQPPKREVRKSTAQPAGDFKASVAKHLYAMLGEGKA